MGQFRVDFVDEVAEVGGCFIVDAFEEHDCFKVLGEIFYFFIGHLSLEYFDDVFFLGAFDLFCQTDDLFLDIEQSLHVLADLAHLHLVAAHNFFADGFDFDVGLVGDLVDEVSDSQFGALRKDVQDVLALHETTVLYGPQDGLLALCWHEAPTSIFLPWHLE